MLHLAFAYLVEKWAELPGTNAGWERMFKMADNTLTNVFVFSSF